MKKNFNISVKLLIVTCLMLSGSLHGAILIPSNDSTQISMKPFGDSMRHWYGIRDKGNIIQPKPDQPRYTETEITMIADNMLLYQRNNGGWPKNYDMQAILTAEQRDSLVKSKEELHTTFDNSTTFTHIEYLAQVYTITHTEKYREGCIRGISFILSAQFPNGGWPQYFPLQDNYSRRITFNDGAFTGIMQLLKKIVEYHPYFSFIPGELRKAVKIAFDKGVECILKSQISENGKLTAWCQQHNELDLSPAWARAFEPPAICNGESAGIILFLMSIDHPSQDIIRSIESAVKWFNDSKIDHTRVETIKAPAEESKYKTSMTDQIVVTDSLAPPIWTRYYEIKTEKPLFCDRDSKFRYSLSEVSRERRSGYSWYTYAPKAVLNKYPKWQKK
jgi:PelA/Pel-15E family pectate lyase